MNSNNEQSPELDIPTLSEEARMAARERDDVHRAVRDLVVKALSQRPLEPNSVREVAEAVLKGAAEGAPETAKESQEAMRKVVAGVDEAIERVAEASKLAIEEARARADAYSEDDLKQAAEDIASLERMLFDALSSAVKSGTKTSFRILNDLTAHLQKTGTSTGRTVRDTLDDLQNVAAGAGRPSLSDVTRTTRAGAATIAAIGSGILAGFAESLAPKKPGENAEVPKDKS